MHECLARHRRRRNGDCRRSRRAVLVRRDAGGDRRFRETRFTIPGGGWLIGAPVPLPRAWVGEKRMAHLAGGAICEVFDALPKARGRTVLMLCVPEEGRPGRPMRDYALLLRRIAEIVEVEAHSRSRVIAHGRPSGIVALDHARRLLAADEAEYVMLVGSIAT